MNSKNDELSSADLAMNQVLQAERDADQVVADCERESHGLLKAAQRQAQHIAARTNQRISMLQMRHNQKLNKVIHDIEQSAQSAEQVDATSRIDADAFNRLIDELAMELTTDDGDASVDPRT